jgi:hypothetical protein
MTDFFYLSVYITNKMQQKTTVLLPPPSQAAVEPPSLAIPGTGLRKSPAAVCIARSSYRKKRL